MNNTKIAPVTDNVCELVYMVTVVADVFCFGNDVADAIDQAWVAVNHVDPVSLPHVIVRTINGDGTPFAVPYRRIHQRIRPRGHRNFGKSGSTITVTADVICMAKSEKDAVETAVEFVNKVESDLPIVIVRTENPDGTLVDFPTCVVAKRPGSLAKLASLNWWENEKTRL